MLKRISAVILVATVAGLLGAAPAAIAKTGDVVKTGSCSAASTWKLKLSTDDTGIQVEYQVDQNVVGDTWRVRIYENGSKIFGGTRKTKAPSGSFTVRLTAPDPAGTDAFKATARNLSTDEKCVGKASI